MVDAQPRDDGRVYAPDIVSFDIVPPLRPWEQKQKRKTGWTRLQCTSVRSVTRFATSRSPWADDVAFGHSLNRVSGTLKNGNRTDFWLRWTACFRKIDGNWLVAHDQVSVPIGERQSVAESRVLRV